VCAQRELEAPEGVVYMEWKKEFVPYFRDVWHPGQHLSTIAPTDAGKTTLVAGLLKLRRYVLALDPKGGDETLAALEFRRLPTWPGEKGIRKLLREDDEANRPSHYTVGPVAMRGSDLLILRKACADALDAAFDMGRWTIYVDELQVLSDRRMMNLSGKAAKLLVAARSKGVTFISSFQSPSWVPSEAVRQPRWIAVAYTRDTDTVNRLAEVMGRPKGEIRGAVKELTEFHWLIVGRNPREPMIITKPDEVKPKKAE